MHRVHRVRVWNRDWIRECGLFCWEHVITIHCVCTHRYYLLGYLGFTLVCSGSGPAYLDRQDVYSWYAGFCVHTILEHIAELYVVNIGLMLRLSWLHSFFSAHIFRMFPFIRSIGRVFVVCMIHGLVSLWRSALLNEYHRSLGMKFHSHRKLPIYTLNYVHVQLYTR